MLKKDFKKELKEFYNPSGKDISVVDVPAADFVMIDGKGDPNNNKEFQEAVEALFSFSYTLKFKIRNGQAAVDYGVMPLEGLWWAEDMSDFDPEKGNKKNWLWTLMIMQPYITEGVFSEVIEDVAKKKDLPALSKLRLERFDEGRAAQILYTGPYSAEGPTITKIHQKIEEIGGKLSGKHHEIYLSDMRRTSPDKLKTVLRQPFK